MGSHVSVIGLATTTSLNTPKLIDQGMVVYSDENNLATTSSAIDQSRAYKYIVLLADNPEFASATKVYRTNKSLL